MNTRNLFTLLAFCGGFFGLSPILASQTIPSCLLRAAHRVVSTNGTERVVFSGRDTDLNPISSHRAVFIASQGDPGIQHPTLMAGLTVEQRMLIDLAQRQRATTSQQQQATSEGLSITSLRNTLILGVVSALGAKIYNAIDDVSLEWFKRKYFYDKKRMHTKDEIKQITRELENIAFNIDQYTQRICAEEDKSLIAQYKKLKKEACARELAATNRLNTCKADYAKLKAKTVAVASKIA